MFDEDDPGGRDGQGLKSSGGKRSLVLLSCDGAIENYENMKKLFALLDLANCGEPFRFTTDIKLLRIMLGLSGGKPTYGCPYCTGKLIRGVYVKGLNRTLGFCKVTADKYAAAGSIKKDANKFFNCIKTPINIMSGEDDSWILGLYPPPILHTVLLGGPNDLLMAVRKKYPAEFGQFVTRFGFERSEGKGGRYYLLSISSFHFTEKDL